MAAANALFWTLHGWDGSDAMAASSRPHLVKSPTHPYAEPLSSSSMKSLLVTLQGAASIWLLVAGLWSNTFALTISPESIFGPLAVFGLLRLCAAPWLAEDFVYAIADGEYQLEATGSIGDGYISAITHLLDPSRPTSRGYLLPTGNWRS